MHFKFKINENNEIVNYQNRGMELEHELNETNSYYKDNKIALISKRPTPIKVVKCFNKKISEAYFEEASTTDYYGVYKGKYIDFEAKETTSKTSFPLANLRENQIEHIKSVIENKGLSFLIVSFTDIEKYFLLLGKDLISFIDLDERKSIPLSYFKEKGFEIKRGLIPPLDYLAVLDKIVKF